MARKKTKIVSSVFNDICAVMGVTEIPTEHKEILKIVRTAAKSPKSLKDEMEPATQAYLSQVMAKINMKKALPMPPIDETELDEESYDSEEEADDIDVLAVTIPSDFRCKRATKNYSIGQWFHLLQNQQIIIPEIQREEAWSTQKERDLIDSFLLDIPVPSFLLAYEPGEITQRSLLDGLQRTNALKHFLEGKITTGENTEWKKVKFEKLPKHIQEKFMFIELTIIEAEVSSEFWTFIFRQQNRGGSPLNWIEILRAMYRTPMVKSLEAVARHDQLWVGLFGKNKRQKGLGALLRSVWLHLKWEIYQKPIDRFLSACCVRDSSTPDDVRDLVIKLNFIFDALTTSIGPAAFRVEEGKSVNLGIVDGLIHAGLLVLEDRVVEGNIEPGTLDVLSDILKFVHSKILDKNGVIYKTIERDASGRKNVQLRMEEIGNLVKESKQCVLETA